MAQMNKAIDEVRAGEAKRLKRDGYRARVEALPLVSAEAGGELDGGANGEVGRNC